MKDILIIAQYAEMPEESGNCRFFYLFDIIKNKGLNAKIAFSSFSHIKKEQRKFDDCANIGDDIIPIYEPGYKKNISLKRIYSHFILSRKLEKWLNSTRKPDLVYCAVPSLDVAKIAAKFAKKNKIKFVIDIQDLWPEAFEMIIKIPVFSKAVFLPLRKKADSIYKVADGIIAVSETYKERGMRVCTQSVYNESVYLGTDLNTFDEYAKENYIETVKKNDEFWIAYIGTLGHSYDLKLVMDSIVELSNIGINNIRFIIMGDGPMEDEFKSYAKKLNIETWFTGRVSYNRLVTILKQCDVAVNPIRSGSSGSIINKVGDYAAAAIPVLNTQESSEYRNLIKEYNCGINCINGDKYDLAKGIKKLYDDEDMRKCMGENNRKLAEAKFNRRETYVNIVNNIIELINK